MSVLSVFQYVAAAVKEQNMTAIEILLLDKQLRLCWLKLAPNERAKIVCQRDGCSLITSASHFCTMRYFTTRHLNPRERYVSVMCTYFTHVIFADFVFSVRVSILLAIMSSKCSCPISLIRKEMQEPAAVQGDVYWSNERDNARNDFFTFILFLLFPRYLTPSHCDYSDCVRQTSRECNSCNYLLKAFLTVILRRHQSTSSSLPMYTFSSFPSFENAQCLFSSVRTTSSSSNLYP